MSCNTVIRRACVIVASIAVAAFWFSLFRFSYPVCQNLENEEQLPSSGLYVMRDVVEKSELAAMRRYVQRLPPPKDDFRCGTFNPVSDKEDLLDMMPKTFDKLQKLLDKWRRNSSFASPGLCEEGSCNDGENMHIQGGQLVSIDPITLKKVFVEHNSFWGWLPTSFFHGSGAGWDIRMKASYWLCREYLLGLPMPPGGRKGDFNGWHFDLPAYEFKPGTEGRYHKLFMMVDKSSAAHERVNSNLLVLPRNSPGALEFKAHILKAVHDSSIGGLLVRMAGSVIGFRAVVNGLDAVVSQYYLQRHGCVAVLDPGDTLFFREDIMHSTQNFKTRRVAHSINVWKSMKLGLKRSGKGRLKRTNVEDFVAKFKSDSSSQVEL